MATAELLRRVQADDTAPATIEALPATTVELCRRYATDPAADLRPEAHGWLREAARLVRRPTGLAAHRELLTVAGRLALPALERSRTMMASLAAPDRPTIS